MIRSQLILMHMLQHLSLNHRSILSLILIYSVFNTTNLIFSNTTLLIIVTTLIVSTIFILSISFKEEYKIRNRNIEIE